jgi:hypothetical protein
MMCDDQGWGFMTYSRHVMIMLVISMNLQKSNGDHTNVM